MATKRSPRSDSEMEDRPSKRRKLRSDSKIPKPCYFDRLSAEVLCRMLQYLPLRDVMKLDTLSRRLRESVSLHLQLLKTLDLSESNILGPMPSGITDYNLQCLVSRCPNLETIHGLFTGVRPISKEKNDSDLSVEGVVEILNSCPKLKSVELDNPYILEAVLKKLPLVRILGSFINHGGGFPISEEKFSLSKNPKVRYLHLTGVVVPELPRMDSIIYLYLRFVKFSNPNPFSSFMAPNLHTFVMSNCAGPANALKYVPLVTRLAASRALRRLELVRVPFLGGLFQHVLEDTWKFGGFSSVENITFGACKHATEVDLGHLILTCAQKLFQLVIQPSLTKDNMFLALSMAEATFPRIETLHLGYTDPFPEPGRWSTADLVAQGLSDVTEHPALVTDTGVQLAGKLFSNLRNLIAYNCPYLKDAMKWLVEDGTNFAHLRYVHLHRCHSVKLQELCTFIADLPCLESVYLQEMFREPPKGCGHVGLSAGTALGVSAAFLANQDGNPAADPLPGNHQNPDPQNPNPPDHDPAIPPVGKVAMDVANAAGAACGHPDLPSGSGVHQKADYDPDDPVDPKDRALVEEMDALIDAEEKLTKIKVEKLKRELELLESDEPMTEGDEAIPKTGDVTPSRNDVTGVEVEASPSKTSPSPSSSEQKAESVKYEGKGKGPLTGRKFVKGKRRLQQSGDENCSKDSDVGPEEKAVKPDVENVAESGVLCTDSTSGSSSSEQACSVAKPQQSTSNKESSAEPEVSLQLPDSAVATDALFDTAVVGGAMVTSSSTVTSSESVTSSSNEVSSSENSAEVVPLDEVPKVTCTSTCTTESVASTASKDSMAGSVKCDLKASTSSGTLDGEKSDGSIKSCGSISTSEKKPGTSISDLLPIANIAENSNDGDGDRDSPKRTIGTQTTQSRDHASSDSDQSESEEARGGGDARRPPIPVYRISRPGQQLADIPQPPRILPLSSSCLVSLTLYMVGVEELLLTNCVQLTTLHVTACRVLRKVSVGQSVELYRVTVAQCPEFDHLSMVRDISQLRPIKNRVVFLRPMYKYDVTELERVLFYDVTGYHGYLVRDHSLSPAQTIHNKPRFEETAKLFSMINKSILKDWSYARKPDDVITDGVTSCNAKRQLSARTGESEDGSWWDVVSDVPWLHTLYGTPPDQSALHFTLGPAEFKKGIYRPKYHNHTVLANAMKALQYDIAELVECGRDVLHPYVMSVYLNTCDVSGVPTPDVYV